VTRKVTQNAQLVSCSRVLGMNKYGNGINLAKCTQPIYAHLHVSYADKFVPKVLLLT